MQYYNKNEDDDNYGIELEYSKSFENRSKLLFNSSYNIFEYKNKENFNLNINTPMVSKITGNIGYIYPVNSKLSISSYTKYYGKRNVLGDNKSVPEVLLFDVGASYSISKDTKIFLNIKNIFDTKQYYWGYNTNDERMLREGRTWSANFRYDF